MIAAGIGARMNEPGITLVRLPEEDSICRAIIRACNGRFAGTLEFYTDAEQLREFGIRLCAFPSGPGDEARYVIGSRDENWALYMLLRAFLLDRAGHVALEFAVDNLEPSPWHAQANFFIPCEVAALNRLGHQLQAWLLRSDETLCWEVAKN